MLVFSTQLCELAPLYNLLSGSPPSLSSLSQSILYSSINKMCVAGWGVWSPVGDHILQEFNTLFLII